MMYLRDGRSKRNFSPPIVAKSVSASPLGDVTRDDSQRQFLAQHRSAMLEQYCNHSKQCRNNVERLCCAKNRRFESSRVTSQKWLWFQS